MQPDGERITQSAERIADLRREMDARAEEEKRIRERLHKLEGLVGTLVDQGRQARRAADDRQRSIELRLQMLMVIVAIASFASPVVTAIIVHG